MQITRYRSGEFYKAHYDASAAKRIITVFAYLSDVEEGGETCESRRRALAALLDLLPRPVPSPYADRLLAPSVDC